MMRIGFNTLVENPKMPSGSTDFYMQITRELARQDPQNDYYILVSKANRHLYEIDKKNVHLVNCFVSNERPKARIAISQIIIPYRLMQNKIDVLFSPQNISTFYLPRHVKNVVSIIALQHWQVPKTIGWLRAQYRSAVSQVALRQADTIIANSYTAKKVICDKLSVDPQKVNVVYEGLDHSLFFPSNLSAEEKAELLCLGVQKPLILYVSNIWPYRNIHTLIEAFGKLCRRLDSPLDLVLVGGVDKTYKGNSAYMTYLLAICDRYCINERVKFIGYVPNREMPKFYRAADVYVQPSLHESFGKTATEAFACGTPVVSSNASAMPEIIGDAGLLFEASNSDALSDALESILLNHQLRATLIRKGLIRAQMFSFTKQASQLISVFQKVVLEPTNEY